MLMDLDTTESMMVWPGGPRTRSSLIFHRSGGAPNRPKCSARVCSSDQRCRVQSLPWDDFQRSLMGDQSWENLSGRSGARGVLRPLGTHGVIDDHQLLTPRRWQGAGIRHGLIADLPLWCAIRLHIWDAVRNHAVCGSTGEGSVPLASITCGG
jgi:hypothetical protein